MRLEGEHKRKDNREIAEVGGVERFWKREVKGELLDIEKRELTWRPVFFLVGNRLGKLRDSSQTSERK